MTFVCILLVLTLGMGILARKRNKGEAYLPNSPLPTIAAPQDEQSSGPRLEAVTITLTASGFEPVEIKRPAGPVIIALSNHTGLDQVNLRLEVEGGRARRIIERKLPRGRVKFSSKVDLPAGQFVLSEADHPEWVCHINVTEP
jgi:hypothetical protein